MDDRTQPGRHRLFEVFQVDNGKFRQIEGDRSWRVKNLKERLQCMMIQQLEGRGLRRQQFPTLVFFSEDGGVLYDGDVVADYCSCSKDDRPGQRIIMFNMTACVDADQRGPSIPDPNTNGLVHVCDDLRQDLGDQLKGLNIAERSLSDKLIKDVNTVKQAIGLLTGEMDGQDFSILRCGSSLEQLFSRCPVVHRGGERLFREQGEAPPLIECLEGGRNSIDFGKFDDMQNRRNRLLDSLHELQEELQEIELTSREDEGSVSVRQEIHDLLYDPNPKADPETFDVLVNAKTKMCGVVLARLDLISQNQKRLRKCMYKQNSQGDIAQRVNHIKSTCRDLSTLSRMPTAYVYALHEIRRQRKFSEQYRSNVDELRNKLECMRDQEIERRRDFVGKYGKYLPTDWNEFDGLKKKPVDYFRHMPLDEPHDTAPLPEVSEEVVVEAAEAVDPVFAANPTLKGATGWGESMADQGNLDFYEPTTEEQVRLLQKLLLALHAEVGAAKSDRDAALAARDHDARDRDRLLDRLRAAFSGVRRTLPLAQALDPTVPANWPALISQLECAVAEQSNVALVCQLEQTIAAQTRDIEAQRNVIMMRDQDLRERDDERDEDVRRLRTACAALGDAVLPEGLPEDPDLADPSGWPEVVGQLGRLITAQRQQVEQLKQQLASPSVQMSSSSSSYGDGDGADVSGSLASSVTASVGAGPGPAVPIPLVSTTGFAVGSVAFFVPWNSRGENGKTKKGFIAFQSPAGRIKYALDAECVSMLGLGLNKPFVGRITDMSLAEGRDRAVVKAELIAGRDGAPMAGAPTQESSA